jgi:general nucleoside transport system permease protein
MATRSFASRWPIADWQENLTVTRTGVFSIVFILLGIVMLLNIPNSIPEGAVTTLTWGDPRLSNLVLPTREYGLFIGVLYLVGGIFGLVPLPERFNWLKYTWLGLNGVLIIPTAVIITTVNGSANITQTLESSFRLMTPIAIGSLAGLWCERSGVVNVAIEGMMLTGACFGFIAYMLLTPYMGTPTAQLIGVGISVLAGGTMALLHAWLSLTFQTDQIVSGTVINILAVGITSFLRREVLLSSRASRETLRMIEIPVLSEIPIIGKVLFTGKPIFLSMFVLVVVSHIILFYTRWGLRTRAVGENPHAADTLGIDVIKNRYINVVVGGMIAGFAGAWFSLETVGNFDDGMTRGLGFIALAAMIFGKWMPFGAFIGALLFGFSQALNARFQIQGVDIPAQFIQMTPYIVTIIVLAGLVGRAVAPKADGVPYKKE